MKEHVFAAALRALADGEILEFQPLEYDPEGGKWTTLIAESSAVLDHLVYGITYAYRFRARSRTVIVNGIEIPAPLTKMPEEGTTCWVSCPTFTEYCYERTWRMDMVSERMFMRGIIHKDYLSAAAHGRAMVAPTEQEPKK